MLFVRKKKLEEFKNQLEGKMPDIIDVGQLYEVGNRKFFVAELKSDNTYGSKTYHEGLVEVKLAFTQEITEINADDNAVTGNGTIKFAVLPYSVYSKFFNVTTDINGAVVISGKSTKPKQVAFGFYSQVGDGSESIFTIYKAVFSLPSLNSVTFDGKTMRDLTLNVTISPYSYIDADGKKQQATYSILNSKTNKAIWNDVQDDIYIPDKVVE